MAAYLRDAVDDGAQTFDSAYEFLQAMAESGTEEVARAAQDAVQRWSTAAEPEVFPMDDSGRVEVPRGVAALDGNAFPQPEELTAVSLPAGLTTIGEYAFAGSSLTSFAPPPCVTTIGDQAFTYCPP